ncbi:hypothetical protein AVEN_80660-1, partial [Araneus ventricosus]
GIFEDVDMQQGDEISLKKRRKRNMKLITSGCREIPETKLSPIHN